MVAMDKHEPEILWDQTAFEEMKAGWSAERIDEDKRALQKLFRLADEVPLFAEALAWANAHGVKFFVDRQVEGVTGYCIPGTGIVGLSVSGLEKPESILGTIVHEVRHIWQEYNNFGIPNADSFEEYYIATALREADAHAFGERTRDQYRVALLERENKPVLPELQASLDDEAGYMGRKFLEWFDSTSTFYGRLAGERYRWLLGVSRVADNDKGPAKKPLPEKSAEPNYEFLPAKRKYLGGKINLMHLDDVRRIGTSFSGRGNYLAALPPGVLPRQVLSPSLADTFWGVANEEQRNLTTELRKAFLKKKLAHRWQPPQRLQLCAPK